jgi:hypothetical protein
MVRLEQAIKPIQAVTREATQIAPVAILWPIRSFNAMPFEAFSHHNPLRDEMVELLQNCLARQVGVHFIDEDRLELLKVKHDRATLGLASYSHIIVPRCVVIHEDSLQALGKLSGQGVKAWRADQGPDWFQTRNSLVSQAELSAARQKTLASLEVVEPAKLVSQLPCLVSGVKGMTRDIRCTVWEKQGRRTALLINLGEQSVTLNWQGSSLILKPRQVQAVPMND